MTTTTPHHAGSSRARRAELRARAHRRSIRERVGVALVVLGAIVGAVVLAVRADQPASTTLGSIAPGFELVSSAGGRVSLASHRGHDVLLYFNEGVGCDACFYQQQRIEADQARFDAAGLVVLPIVVNPARAVRTELQRFGLRTPYLLDSDRHVSRAYDTIGRGHHADLPGHSFVLVDGDGRMRWRLDDPSMFVEPSRLLDGALGALGRS